MVQLAILQVLQIATVLCCAPLLRGIINRLKAIVQSRRGPSIWQPYRDLWKLLRKGRVVSEHASWVFHALLLLTTFAMVATRLLSGAIGAYAVQSLVLGLVAAVVAYFTGSSDLYIVAVLTIIVKCGSPSFCVILEGGNRS